MSPVKFPADGLFAGPTMFSSFLIMSQMKAGASLFGGRLLKSAATSALALSVVAGGVMLSGGEAKAVACNGTPLTFTDTGLNPPVTFTDKCQLISNTVGPDPSYVRIFGNPMYPNVQTTVDFDGPITTGEVRYKMTKTSPEGPDYYFDAFQLRWEPPAIGTGSITKSIYSDSSFNNPPIASSSTNGGVVLLPNRYKELWVSDVVTTTGGGVIPNMNNDFRNVPGPLPVLGAGAAFGFSRKLRSRIKAARTA
jgi:hypothetical protein